MKTILRRIAKFPEDYLSEIEDRYNANQSINNIAMWRCKLDELSVAVENGYGSYRQVENLVFELKVMNFVRNVNPDCKIIYEPVGLLREGKTCDLLIESDRNYLVELKSFHPQRKSTAIPYDHVTENNELIMDGYSYHELQAVRGHLIEETFDAEDKFDNYNGDEHIKVLGILLGYYLHLEYLRDFVTIYRKGTYRPNDPLGKMTMYNIKKEYRGVIDEFWGFPFDQIGFYFLKGKAPVSVSLVQGMDGTIKL